MTTFICHVERSRKAQSKHLKTDLIYNFYILEILRLTLGMTKGRVLGMTKSGKSQDDRYVRLLYDPNTQVSKGSGRVKTLPYNIEMPLRPWTEGRNSLITE